MVYDYDLLRPDAPASDFTCCIDLRTALTVREEQRVAGRKVVWTNGCFDLFHAGHARFLAAARALGDLLIVGLNSDESVRRVKGRERPFTPFGQRVTVLLALRSVDYVLPLSEDRPNPEIATLRPDVCCKDDSYAHLPLPERELVESYGGCMTLLPRVTGLSTTEMARLLRSTSEGGPGR